MSFEDRIDLSRTLIDKAGRTFVVTEPDGSLPLGGGHPLGFFRDVDGGRGQRQDQPDSERDGPGLAERHGDGHHGERGEADLPAAQTQQPRPHRPECLRFQL